MELVGSHLLPRSTVSKDHPSSRYWMPASYFHALWRLDISWVIVGFIFQFVIRRRHFAWWSKYNYVLSAAMDSGVALSVVFIFFTSAICRTLHLHSLRLTCSFDHLSLCPTWTDFSIHRMAQLDVTAFRLGGATLSTSRPQTASAHHTFRCPRKVTSVQRHGGSPASLAMACR